MSWDPSSECCHTAQWSIPDQPVVTGKMAASHREQQQRKHCRRSNTGRGEGRRRMNRRGCFQFSEDTPNIIKEKCKLGHAQSNFNDSPPHTHSLSFAMHFTSAAWIFPFQANAGLFPERKRRRKMRGSSLCFQHTTPRHLNHYSSEKKWASEFININCGS